MTFGSAVSSLQSSVDVGKESDSSMGSEVDFSDKRRDSNVEPVFIKRGELVS